MTHLKLNPRPIDAGFNNLLNDFFGNWPVYGMKDPNGKWNNTIPVNIRENENAYELELVAPGFEKSDFVINVDENLLTIEAKHEEQQVKQEGEKNNWVRREFVKKSFKRSFTIDDKVETADIQAKYENGVLQLNLPKKATVKPSAKQISIR
jgi:HSP20 family protein